MDGQLHGVGSAPRLVAPRAGTATIVEICADATKPNTVVYRPKMMISKGRVLASVLGICAAVESADAAPVAGYVLDGETLAPVVGATIAGPGAVSPTQSGDDGGFRFADVPGDNVTVTFTAPGYEPATQEVVIGSEEPLSLIMYKTGALGEVIELVGRAPKPVALGTQNLTTQELVRVPGGERDALAAIRGLPSVSTSPAPGAQGLILRGGSPDDSKFMIEGITIPRIYHVFNNTTIIPTRFIEAIEFSPGGFGAEEGRATSGVVSLTTASSLLQPNFAESTVSFLEVGGLFSTKLDRAGKWGVSGGFRRSTVDALLPLILPSDADVNFTTYPTYYDGQLRVDYRPTSQDRIAVLGIGSFDEIALVNSKPSDGSFGSFGNSTTFGRLLTTWYHEGKKLRNRAVLSVGADRLRIAIGATNKVDVDLVPVTFRDDVRIPWKTGQFRAGVEATTENYKVDVLAPVPRAEGEPPIKPAEQPLLLYQNQFNRRYLAAYVAVDLDLNKTLRITPSVRAEYFSRQQAGVLLPRLQLEQKFSWGSVKGAMGRYARGPDANAQGAATNLVPEIAAQYVLGVETPVVEGATVAVSGFYSRRSDLTSTLRGQTSVDGLPYFSLGSGRSYGLELLARYNKGDWYGWIAYSLSRSERRDTADSQMRLSDFDQTHNASAVVSRNWRSWKFSGRMSLLSGTPFTDVTGASFDASADRYIPSFGRVNGARLDLNHQLDLRAERTWTFKAWALTAFVDVANVYRNARVVQYNYNRDYTEREATTEFVPIPSLGARGVF